MRAQDQGKAGSQNDEMMKEIAAQITNIENKVNSQNSEMQTQMNKISTQLNEKLDRVIQVMLPKSNQKPIEDQLDDMC